MDPSQPSAILSRLFGLTGRVAVVVGGAGRIGRSLCLALSQAGARVCVLDLDRQRAEETVHAIRSADGPSAMAHVADATQAEALDQAVAAVQQQLGQPDILVNSAQFRGTGFYSSQVNDYPLAAWNQVLSVNLTGVYLACQAFGRAMAEHGGGSDCQSQLDVWAGLARPADLRPIGRQLTRLVCRQQGGRNSVDALSGRALA